MTGARKVSPFPIPWLPPNKMTNAKALVVKLEMKMLKIVKISPIVTVLRDKREAYILTETV